MTIQKFIVKIISVISFFLSVFFLFSSIGLSLLFFFFFAVMVISLLSRDLATTKKEKEMLRKIMSMLELGLHHIDVDEEKKRDVFLKLRKLILDDHDGYLEEREVLLRIIAAFDSKEFFKKEFQISDEEFLYLFFEYIWDLV